MIEPQLLDFVAKRNAATLATIKGDGRPQLSNVNYAFDAAGNLVQMSLTADRAKVKNLRRDPRASMLVQSPDGWTYAVVEGQVTLSETAADPHDATVEELIDVFRAVSGKEHPDWDEYRRAMVDDKRLVARLQVTHAYGLPAR
ncbi:MAG: PPOX class F420-dependent oxidoreductase [Propionibacteriales bacterium]|nr:PPOX class F420-dependent oxidoreductase [Propionibacteriales bacterium]